MSESISIRLPRQLQKDLESLTREEKVSKSDVIRQAIEQYLSLRKFRALRKKTLPFAEAQGWITDDDVFKALA